MLATDTNTARRLIRIPLKQIAHDFGEEPFNGNSFRFDRRVLNRSPRLTDSILCNDLRHDLVRNTDV